MSFTKVKKGVCAAKGFVANGLNCGLNSDKNKNMTDTQKVQAMQLANVMAKQITAEQSQKQLNLAA